MNTVDRKLRFVQEFLRIADEDILTKLEQLLGSERTKKASKMISPMSLDEFNKSIDQSEDDFKNGKFIESNELLKSIESWK
jgi:hypothetical protein